jgi:tRNA(Ile)-lysidine synthase
MDDIYNRFRDFVFSNNLILKSERILLSLSAGKDSMFMLHLLKRLQDELSFEIGIFHLNHLTRGEETDKDETFVKEKSASCNIPCSIERFNFRKNRIPSISFEEQARNLRYLLLNKIAETENYTKIATAHNLNDNAETLLMRILSGTGIAGLKGILPSSGNIIRPILFADKNEIYTYLKNNNIDWREDLSNEENLYLRNYIRNIIIPQIKEKFPNSEENLNNLAAHAIENQSLLHDLTERLYPDVVTKNGGDTIIDIDSFSDDIPLIKYFLSRVLYESYRIKLKISIYNEIIRRFMINSANMILYEKNNLTIRKGLWNDETVIIITETSDVEDAPDKWEYPVPVEGDITIQLIEIRKELKISYVNYEFYTQNKNNQNIICIQAESEIKSIILRNRRPGDYIKLEMGTRKIKDLMIEKKLDSRMKNSIPMIAVDDEIAAYLPGLINSNNNRVACNFHIRNDTKRILAFFFRDY